MNSEEQKNITETLDKNAAEQNNSDHIKLSVMINGAETEKINIPMRKENLSREEIDKMIFDEIHKHYSPAMGNVTYGWSVN